MTQSKNHSYLWLRDFVTPSAVEYVILLRERSVSLVRVIGNGDAVLLLSDDAPGGDVHAVREFFGRLHKGGYSYGQPFSVLIHHHRCFSYLRFLDPRRPEQFAERIRKLEDSRISFSQEMREIGARRLFIGQGIEREYAEGVSEAARAAGLNVTGINTLVAHIGRTADISALPSTVRVELPDAGCFRLTADESGGILIEELLSPSVPVSILSPGDQSGEKNAGPVIAYTPRTAKPVAAVVGTKVLPVAAVLTGACRQGSRTGGGTPYSRGDFFLMRATNVGKLLTLVLLTTLFLSGLCALVLRAYANSDGVGLDEYQQAYGRRMELEAATDSLQESLDSIRRDLPVQTSSAPWIALFCQRRFPSLYLSRLQVIHAEDGKSQILATGIAENESGIFSLLSYLQDEGGGDAWELQNLGLTTLATSAGTDTVQSFSIQRVWNSHE